MISSWTSLRSLAWLKRLALAQERIATATETLARIGQDEWEAKHAPRPRAARFVAGQMDVEATNKLYREMNKSDFDIE